MATTSINLSLCTSENAVIPVNDHGFLYGDGVFEGLRFYGGRVLKQEAHLVRLEKSAQCLALDLPFTRAQMVQSIADTIAASGESDGYVRLIVTRGCGPLGIDPSTCSRGNLVIIVDQLAMVSDRVRQEGASLVISSLRRLAPDQLDPRIKSLNYMNQILARLEANQAGADEAVVLNSHGHVAEGTADNIFIVQSGKLLTPPVTDGALEGVTRGILLELAEQCGIDVSIASLTPYDLFTAEECFLSGTGAELIPVKAVSGREVQACPGPVYQQLSAAFEQALADGSYFSD